MTPLALLLTLATALPAAPSFTRVAREAAAARDTGRLEDAIRLYREALRLRPVWNEGRWYLGTILYDLDRYEEAEAAFRRLVSADRNNAAGWALKGLCEFQLRNYERSLVDLQRARTLGLAVHPELVSVSRYHTAILFTRFEQFEIAYETLKEFAADGNDSPNVIEAIGLSLLRLPFLPAELPPEKREMVLMAGRAGYQAAARKPDAARQALTELVDRFPEAPNVHYAYGNFLLRENPDAAIEEFRRELVVSPGHVQALLQIAFEYIKRGDYASARPLAEQAATLAPAQFAARNALGRVLLETGDTAGAITQLEAGVKLAPDSPEMRFALARAYSRAGRTRDADRERAAFLRLDKEYKLLKSGPQSVGGIDKADKEPPPREPPPR